MVNSVTLDSYNVTSNHRIRTLMNKGGASSELVMGNNVQRNLITEDLKAFDRYIEHLDLGQEANQVILSSLHHYYYDAEEMTDIKIVINLKELNQIKDLKEFLHSMVQIIPPDCNFLGCFVNSRKQSGFILKTSPEDNYYKRNSDAIEKGIVSSSPFLNMLYNMIDSKTNKYMSERSISQIFGENAFKVTDFTEIDGLTYFCAKRLQTADK